MKRPFLFEKHTALSAKILPFAGYDMPISYKGIIIEHSAVRASCGIFDVTHMGILDVSGEDAEKFLLKTCTNNILLLKNMGGQYAVISDEAGGTLDDIFIFKIGNIYRLVINASNREKIIGWFLKNSKSFSSLKIVPREDLGILSFQGPKAKEFFKAPLPERNGCGYYGNILFSRTGYTGEDGFEFFATKEEAFLLWDKIISFGAEPCGLGARDTLRIEAGLPLYGHEYNEGISPFEVGYPWAVKFDHDFIGKNSMLKKKEDPSLKKLFGLVLKDKAIPREGAGVFKNGVKIGEVSSGTFSPTLKIPVALAFLAGGTASIGEEVEVEIRGKRFPSLVSKKKMV